MSAPASRHAAAAPSSDSGAEAVLAPLEAAVRGLTLALRAGDAAALEAAAGQLHASLLPAARHARAVHARDRETRELLHRRLAAAAAELAAQREGVARAGASMARAAAVLWPVDGGAYGAGGSGARPASTGGLIA